MSDIVRLRDSKKLTPKQRHIWFDYIKKHPNIFFAAAKVYPKLIDKINISQAANLAATRALRRLLNSFTIVRLLSNESRQKIKIFLDGGLYVKDKKFKNFKIKTVIGGDEKINAIKLASIAAKVKRDRLMTELHKKFPQYGFDKHKGYGTKAHFTAIRRFGLCPLHRLTFVKKHYNIK